MPWPSRCHLPQVDYYLGLDAQRFLGNSVSTFTAFIMLERKWAHRWASSRAIGWRNRLCMAGGVL